MNTSEYAAESDEVLGRLLAIQRIPSSSPQPSQTGRRSRTPTPSPRQTPRSRRFSASWASPTSERATPTARVSRPASPSIIQQALDPTLVSDIFDSGAASEIIDEFVDNLPPGSMNQYIQQLPTPTGSPPGAGATPGVGTSTVTSPTAPYKGRRPAGVGRRPSAAYLHSLGKV